MIISSVNSVPMAKNYVKTNKNNSNSMSNSSCFTQNHRLAHKPSFGLDPFLAGGLLAMTVAQIIDTYRTQKQLNQLKEKRNQIPIQSQNINKIHKNEVTKTHDEEVAELAKKLNVSKKEAEEYIEITKKIIEDTNKKQD